MCLVGMGERRREEGMEGMCFYFFQGFVGVVVFGCHVCFCLCVCVCMYVGAGGVNRNMAEEHRRRAGESDGTCLLS